MPYHQVVFSQAEYDAKYGCNDCNLFIDYIKCADSRFDEICDLYLNCITVEDIEYMKPEDFICLVPEEQIKHKQLMTILVRRYIFDCDDTCDLQEQINTIVECEKDNFSSDSSDSDNCKKCPKKCKKKNKKKKKKY